MSSSGGGLRAAAAARAAEEEGPLRMPRMIHPENAEVDAWLAKEEPEEVIEPELPIIDAHHHLWDRRTPAPWFTYRTKHYGAADFGYRGSSKSIRSLALKGRVPHQVHYSKSVLLRF